TAANSANRRMSSGVSGSRRPGSSFPNGNNDSTSTSAPFPRVDSSGFPGASPDAPHDPGMATLPRVQPAEALTASDAHKRRQLRRMKAVALGLLVLAAAVYVAATLAGADGWLGYVQAFA